MSNLSYARVEKMARAICDLRLLAPPRVSLRLSPALRDEVLWLFHTLPAPGPDRLIPETAPREAVIPSAGSTLLTALSDSRRVASNLALRPVFFLTLFFPSP
jgi:hypothetical protein